MEHELVKPDSEAKWCLKKYGLEATYWGEIIIEAEERGYFTADEKQMASGWLVCACGRAIENFPFIQRSKCGGVPSDKELLDQGVYFSEAVYRNEFLFAAETLGEIEQRVRVLIEEHAAKELAVHRNRWYETVVIGSKS